jgi:hypothetical protein
MMNDDVKQGKAAPENRPELLIGDDAGERERAVDAAALRTPARLTQGQAFWNDAEKEEVYRSRWVRVQTDFVDDPSESVRSADALVSEMIETLSDSFMEARSSLEERWSDGRDASTEDLRVSLIEYQDLFDRLMRIGK